MNIIFGIILIILMFVSFIMGSYFDTMNSVDSVNTFKNTKINNFIIILFRFIIPAIAVIIFYLNIRYI